MLPAEGRPRPKKEQVAEKEVKVWNLRQTGASIRRIGAELGIPFTTVQAALHRVCKRILAKMEAEVAADKIAQLNQLDGIIDEAMQAWEKSKTPSVCGDATYLNQARAAMADKRKITGIDAPTKTAATNPAGDQEAGKAQVVVYIPANGRDVGGAPAPDGGT
jgi:hypothetical protein